MRPRSDFVEMGLGFRVWGTTGVAKTAAPPSRVPVTKACSTLGAHY